MGIFLTRNADGSITVEYDDKPLPAGKRKRRRTKKPSWERPIPVLPRPRVSIIVPGDRIPEKLPDTVTIPWKGIAQFSRDLKQKMRSSITGSKRYAVNVSIRPGSTLSLDDMLSSAGKVAGMKGGSVQLILTSKLLKK